VTFERPNICTTASSRPGSCAHDLHHAFIYESDAAMVDRVTEHAAAGLRAGDAVMLIATPGHLAAVEERLLLARFDLVAALERGAYFRVSAREAVAQMVGPDGPSPLRFLDFIAPRFARATEGRRRFRAYGEAVSLLVEDGREEAALELEGLWNGFFARTPFSMMCGYARADLRGPSMDRMCSGIRASHAETHEVARVGGRALV